VRWLQAEKRFQPLNYTKSPRPVTPLDDLVLVRIGDTRRRNIQLLVIRGTDQVDGDAVGVRRMAVAKEVLRRSNLGVVRTRFPATQLVEGIHQITYLELKAKGIDGCAVTLFVPGYDPDIEIAPRAGKARVLRPNSSTGNPRKSV